MQGSQPAGTGPDLPEQAEIWPTAEFDFSIHSGSHQDRLRGQEFDPTMPDIPLPHHFTDQPAILRFCQIAHYLSIALTDQKSSLSGGNTPHSALDGLVPELTAVRTDWGSLFTKLGNFSMESDECIRTIFCWFRDVKAARGQSGNPWRATSSVMGKIPMDHHPISACTDQVGFADGQQGGDCALMSREHKCILVLPAIDPAGGVCIQAHSAYQVFAANVGNLATEWLKPWRMRLIPPFENSIPPVSGCQCQSRSKVFEVQNKHHSPCRSPAPGVGNRLRK